MLQIQGAGAPTQVEAGATSFSFVNGLNQTGYIDLAAQYDQASHFLVLDSLSQPAGSGGSSSLTVIKAWLDAANPRIAVRYNGSGSGATSLRWRILKAAAGLRVQQGVVTAAFPAGGDNQCLTVGLSPELPRADKALLVVNFAGGSFCADNGSNWAYGLYPVLDGGSTLRLYANYNNAGAGIDFTLPWCVVYGR